MHKIKKIPVSQSGLQGAQFRSLRHIPLATRTAVRGAHRGGQQVYTICTLRNDENIVSQIVCNNLLTLLTSHTSGDFAHFAHFRKMSGHVSGQLLK